MLKISLEDCDSAADVADRLRHVATLLEQGYTSGYHPYWEVDAPEDAEIIRKTAQ